MQNKNFIAIALVGLAVVMVAKKTGAAPAFMPISLPTNFTATLSQLQQLEAAGYAPDSTAYKAAVDESYARVAATLLPNQVVAWSSARGYYAVTVGSSEYYAIM